jgi:hypothetical protein
MVRIVDCIIWRLTRFYGHPEKALKTHFWELLHRLHSNNNLPLLVFGEFNEIMVMEEKELKVVYLGVQIYLPYRCNGQTSGWYYLETH